MYNYDVLFFEYSVMIDTDFNAVDAAPEWGESGAGVIWEGWAGADLIGTLNVLDTLTLKHFNQISEVMQYYFETGKYAESQDFRKYEYTTSIETPTASSSWLYTVIRDDAWSMHLLKIGTWMFNVDTFDQYHSEHNLGKSPLPLFVIEPEQEKILTFSGNVAQLSGGTVESYLAGNAKIIAPWWVRSDEDVQEFGEQIFRKEPALGGEWQPPMFNHSIGLTDMGEADDQAKRVDTPMETVDFDKMFVLPADHALLMVRNMLMREMESDDVINAMWILQSMQKEDLRELIEKMEDEEYGVWTFPEEALERIMHMWVGKYTLSLGLYDRFESIKAIIDSFDTEKWRFTTLPVV